MDVCYKSNINKFYKHKNEQNKRHYKKGFLKTGWKPNAIQQKKTTNILNHQFG